MSSEDGNSFDAKARLLHTDYRVVIYHSDYLRLSPFSTSSHPHRSHVLIEDLMTSDIPQNTPPVSCSGAAVMGRKNIGDTVHGARESKFERECSGSRRKQLRDSALSKGMNILL